MNTDGRPIPKSRPPCYFYRSETGCSKGDSCRFLHDGPTSPHEQNKTCRFFAAGYCSRAEKCWYRHVTPDPPSTSPSDPEDQVCGICYDPPIQYGLLIGCSHKFCLSCIRTWRSPTGKESDMEDSAAIKACPLCRAPSRFIAPSSQFYPDSHPKKQEMIDNYKASMAKITCRYFSRSKPGNRFCPYGNDCFYQHQKEDGTPHQFNAGVDLMMQVFKDRVAGIQYSQRRAQRLRLRLRANNLNLDPSELQEWVDNFIGHSEGLQSMLQSLEAAEAAYDLGDDIDIFGLPTPSFLQPPNAEADEHMPLRSLPMIDAVPHNSVSFRQPRDEVRRDIDNAATATPSPANPFHRPPDELPNPPDQSTPSEDSSVPGGRRCCPV